MTPPPIVSFHKGHGTDGEEHIHEGIETLDNGFIGIGHTQDFPESETLDILIIKTDSNGEEIWSKKIGATGEWDVGIAIAESIDSFYAVGGKSHGGIQKPVIIKMTKGGDIVWEKILDTPRVGMLRGIDITQSGEIAVTGFHGGDEEGFVFISEAIGFAAVLDGEGAVVWQEDYEQIPQGTKILSTDTNGYAILSTVWNYEENNAAILKIGNSGEVQWYKSYGGGHNQAFDFEYIPEEGYVLAGHTNSISAVNWDGLMTKVDTSGNLIWRRTVGQPRGYDSRYIHDEFYGIVVDTDGSYVMAGGTGDETDEYEEDGHPSGPSGEWKSYIVKINSNGDFVWEEVYGESNEGHNAAEFLDSTDDGGFILFNDSDNESISKKAPNNFGFMKLRSAGSAPDTTEIDELVYPDNDITSASYEIFAPKKYKRKFVDKITNFNPTTDTLEIHTDSFGIDHSFTFAAGNNKKAVKKHAKQDFSFLYDQKKGCLYFNENGSDKGFGDGGIIAILKGAPDLTLDNLDFV
jgi:hypothetical protein